jgi:hypothetical protein
MNSDMRLEELLTGMLVDVAPTAEPERLVPEILRAARRERRRPRWLVLATERPMRQGSAVAFGSPTMRLAYLGVVLAILLSALVVILVVGGALLNPPRVLPQDPEPVPGIFVPTGDIPESMGWLLRPGVAVLDDGRVLVAGGGQETPLASIYDPTSETFGPAIPMPAMHQGATATTLLDGRVLVTGGNDGMTGAVLDAASMLDVVGDTFTAVGPMLTARDFHTATRLRDGRVLIVGGVTADGLTIADAELFDPATDTFSPTGSLTFGRGGHSATLLRDGSVAIIGGYSSDAGGRAGTLATAEIYDPATGAFRTVESTATARANHSAVALGDGRVLIVGGLSEFQPQGGGRGYLGSADLFDPSSEVFTAAAGSLTTERSGASATLLPDGDVLVAGGGNSFGSPLSAELFDPGLQRFTKAGDTSSLKTITVAPLLADGRVFMPGAGRAPDGGSELYLPGGRPVSTPSPLASERPPIIGVPVSGVTLRRGHTATGLPDGRVLITGGQGGDQNDFLQTAEVFDPTTGVSVATGSMASIRVDHAAVPMPDGRVLVIGGGFDPGGAEVYDPDTGTFGPVPQEIDDALEGHRVLPVMGLTDGLLLLEDDARTLTLLDMATGQLTPAGDACYWFEGGVALSDGRLFGGCGADTGAIISDPALGTSVPAPGISGEIWEPYLLPDDLILGASRQGGEIDAVRMTYDLLYDPASGELRRITADTASSPMAGTTVTLPDGRLLMVGGDLGVTSDAVRILDPDGWQYREVGRLVTPRTDATATLLPDGRVLVVGGTSRPPDRDLPAPPWAELIDPSAIGG